MKINNHTLFKGSVITVLIALTTSVNALEKPQTMEEMWKIIEAQQKQIDEMKTAMAAKVPKTADGSVKNLERKTDVLSQEVEKLRTNLVIPEETKYKSAYGLGPAASKVYQVGKGLSIGGYGEGHYQANVGEKGNNKDNADLERMVLYAGYKFTDRILFNSELEFEHASTGEGAEEKGEVSVEFAALDFFIDPLANIRAGLVLMPMGFINQIHEPPFYFGNNRPEVERRIIPSTWREVGVGLFGQITPELTYTTYVVNGLDASEFSADGIRGGRGQGSQAKAENFGFVGRVDYTPAALPGVTVGGSAYVGNSGQNQSFAGTKADVFTQLYEGHLQWKYRGLEFRTLGSWGHINDAELLSAQKGEAIGSENFGWYAEVGYDILPWLFNDTTQYLAPFIRYERLDTIAKAPDGFADDLSKDWQIYQAGLQYKPIPNVVLKADYRNRVAKQGPLSDDFNLGFGFIF
ncbi:conserved exported hypothetical protein [Candidatus Methylobacter favarea]|uniref:Porin n=1 Tax=Candidatus Methylobacter favarea TaxID=2707345 RepID=A0A8S0YAK9_9GAMM|nr:hypothetical protein [Candidatus Methylobacter favarea]CAA9892127.1 conserved exported hypothetical protein [Candidatus Methylobacter favarea]